MSGRPQSGRPGSARERPGSARTRPESASNKGGSRPGSARPATETMDGATSDAAVEGFRAALGSVEQLEDLLAKVAEEELGGRVSATGLRKLAKKIGHPDPAPQVLAAILTAVDIGGRRRAAAGRRGLRARFRARRRRLGSWRDVRASSRRRATT